MGQGFRKDRLASEIVKETSKYILYELRDPRKGFVTVTRAKVSDDYRYAKIFVSIMGTEKEQQLTMHGLKSAAGFIQTKLADRLTSRYVPHVTFVLDEGVKKSIEMTRLINEALGRTADNTEPADGTAEEQSQGE